MGECNQDGVCKGIYKLNVSMMNNIFNCSILCITALKIICKYKYLPSTRRRNVASFSSILRKGLALNDKEKPLEPL